MEAVPCHISVHIPLIHRHLLAELFAHKRHFVDDRHHFFPVVPRLYFDGIYVIAVGYGQISPFQLYTVLLSVPDHFRRDGLIKIGDL